MSRRLRDTLSFLVSDSMTIELEGEEVDVPVRAYVAVERERGQSVASIDGEVEAYVAGVWTAIEGEDANRASDILCELALEDDSDEGLEYEPDDDDYEPDYYEGSYE